MAEYTYADVIIDPEDPRVEIGKEYWMDNIPSECLRSANEDKTTLTLNKIEPNRPWPFYSTKSGSCVCIIRKKEPKKKYVPFDLSDAEVRKGLRGKWIKNKTNNDEICIQAFYHQGYVENTIVADIYKINGIDSDELFNNWTFDDGSPCGKLVEEEA